jgi:hypothetical protein
MPEDDPVVPADKRRRTPLEALRMDKTAFSVISLKESGNDKEFWRTQSTAARLQALELMRQVMYGYDPISARVERIFTVIERKPR